jgi:hypothetical protein
MSLTLDISRLDSELSTDDFDAISFVNALLPNKSSLSDLPHLMRQLQSRTIRGTACIRESVRSHSVLGDSSDAILADARRSISDLSDRISAIHNQAAETELIVSRVCTGIRPLDHAKSNLTACVTGLRRLKMAMDTVDALQKNVDEHNYQQCADNILALTSLLDSFRKFMTPQIGALGVRFFDLKRRLRNNVNLELEDRLFRGAADETNLPLCAVIDAFADDFRSSTIFLFCHKFLSPYDAYETRPLEEVSSRFQWFKQRLDFYYGQYQKAFPKDWRMPYHLAIEFCKKTAGHLGRVMNQTELDVRVYLSAFELTVKFEQKMAELFATTETVFINPDDPIPEFENTPDGVRQKVEWRIRRDNGIGETRKVPAAEFIGSIVPAFASHMSLYVASENEAIMRIINNAKKHPFEDIDTTHQLKSVTPLVKAMRCALDKCAGFNLPQALLDLFVNFKSLLSQYVQTLTRVLPSRPKTDQEYQLLAATANTSALLLSIIDSLGTKVSSLVSADLRDVVVVDDAKEAIGVELRQQLLGMVEAVARECEPTLAQMATGSWDVANADAGRLPAKLGEILRQRFTVLGTWLSNDNMNRLRSTLANRLVTILRDHLFRQKAFTADHGWKLSSAAKELKMLIASWTQADSALAKKRIDAEFVHLEVELRVLSSPDPKSMAVSYATTAPQHSREHYRSLVKVRGITNLKEQERYMEEYDVQMAVLAPT